MGYRRTMQNFHQEGLEEDSDGANVIKTRGETP